MKVCVITSTRAEYGLLKPVIEKIRKHSKLKLQIIATGTHLEEEYGYTVKEIEEDGYYIDAKIKIVDGDSKLQILQTMSNSLERIGKVLNELNPNIIVIDGDRYEMPPIALAANILGIPIAHIGGGDITEGAYDDVFRHTLTKLSNIHFPTTEIYRKRIIQMGEQPTKVFNVGSTGVENILEIPLLSKVELEKQIDFKFKDNTVMVTFHPVTNEADTQIQQFNDLLDALQESNFRMIFTRPNADTNRKELNDRLDKFLATSKGNSIAFESMGILKYLSAMKYSVAVIGNSSSGIYEAPSFGIGTINIGNRQKGRIKSTTIIDCKSDKESIASAINKLQSEEFKEQIKHSSNPYKGIRTSTKIVDEIYNFLKVNDGLPKRFYDI
jgi:UDP-hydrolysing UDP-N-acetyl-D-glucosamine 2-epimerase